MQESYSQLDALRNVIEEGLFGIETTEVAPDQGRNLEDFHNELSALANEMSNHLVDENGEWFKPTGYEGLTFYRDKSAEKLKWDSTKLPSILMSFGLSLAVIANMPPSSIENTFVAMANPTRDPAITQIKHAEVNGFKTAFISLGLGITGIGLSNAIRKRMQVDKYLEAKKQNEQFNSIVNK